MSYSYDYKFKYIVLGDTGVGKSCLQLRFVENKFDVHEELAATMGVGFGERTIAVGGKHVRLTVWDTAGQERYRAITRSYYKDAAGALLVYDITRRETFDHVTNWLDDVRQHGSPNLPIMLVGNKCDLDRGKGFFKGRAVCKEEGERFAEKHGLLFFEASAKTGHNVEEAFLSMSRTIDEKIQKGEIDASRKAPGIVLGYGRDQGAYGGRYGPIVPGGSSCCST